MIKSLSSLPVTWQLFPTFCHEKKSILQLDRSVGVNKWWTQLVEQWTQCKFKNDEGLFLSLHFVLFT